MYPAVFALPELLCSFISYYCHWTVYTVSQFNSWYINRMQGHHMLLLIIPLHQPSLLKILFLHSIVVTDSLTSVHCYWSKSETTLLVSWILDRLHYWDFTIAYVSYSVSSGTLDICLLLLLPSWNGHLSPSVSRRHVVLKQIDLSRFFLIAFNLSRSLFCCCFLESGKRACLSAPGAANHVACKGCMLLHCLNIL